MHSLDSFDFNLEPTVRDFYIQKEYFKSTSGDVLDGVITPGWHRVLRFDMIVKNEGPDDFVIGRPADHKNWFEWSNAHGHYHLEDFNRYTLIDRTGKVIVGQKQSFCLEDSVRVSSWADPDDHYHCNYQGISAGWADVYEDRLPGQYIHIDNIPNGIYRLRAKTDYSNRFHETDGTDNTVEVGLRIRGNTVTVIDPPHLLGRDSDQDFWI